MEGESPRLDLPMSLKFASCAEVEISRPNLSSAQSALVHRDDPCGQSARPGLSDTLAVLCFEFGHEAERRHRFRGHATHVVEEFQLKVLGVQ